MQILFIALLKVLLQVFISTTLMMPSVPGNTFVIRPIFHSIGGKWSSFSNVPSKGLHGLAAETNGSKNSALAVERACNVTLKKIWFLLLVLKQFFILRRLWNIQELKRCISPLHRQWEGTVVGNLGLIQFGRVRYKIVHKLTKHCLVRELDDI